MEEQNNNQNNKMNKKDGGPRGNIGSCWNKQSRKRGDNFMLMKLTVKEPGNQTFVLFKNENKDTSTDEGFYDKEPAFYIFPYKAKEESGNN